MPLYSVLARGLASDSVKFEALFNNAKRALVQRKYRAGKKRDQQEFQAKQALLACLDEAALEADDGAREAKILAVASKRESSPTCFAPFAATPSTVVFQTSMSVQQSTVSGTGEAGPSAAPPISSTITQLQQTGGSALEQSAGADGSILLYQQQPDAAAAAAANAKAEEEEAAVPAAAAPTAAYAKAEEEEAAIAAAAAAAKAKAEEEEAAIAAQASTSAPAMPWYKAVDLSDLSWCSGFGAGDNSEDELKSWVRAFIRGPTCKETLAQ